MPRTIALLGPLLALLLTLTGLLVVIEAVGFLVGSDPVLLDWRGLLDDAGSDRWSSQTVRGVCAVSAAVGIALVVLTLRGSRADVTLRTGVPALAGTTSRRAVARLVATSVRDADGVSGAVDVVVGRSTVRVRVTHSGLDAEYPGTLAERARTAATGALATLPLERTPTVTVSERTPRTTPGGTSTP